MRKNLAIVVAFAFVIVFYSYQSWYKTPSHVDQSISSNLKLDNVAMFASYGIKALQDQGKTGKNKTVVVLDQGDTVNSACFSTTDDVKDSLCQGCALDICWHGHFINSIIRDIAPDVEILSVQVYSRLGENLVVDRQDLLDALDWVTTQKNHKNIVAVNLSLNFNSGYANFCDEVDVEFTKKINHLSELGIKVFNSTGNDGWQDKISFPSCIENIVSVGALENQTTQLEISNRSKNVDILAPGFNIVGEIFEGEKLTKKTQTGTSFATAVATGKYLLELE